MSALAGTTSGSALVTPRMPQSIFGLRATAKLIKKEGYRTKRLLGHDPGDIFCPPTTVNAGQTSLPGMQVSTSAPKFDSCAYPYPLFPRAKKAVGIPLHFCYPV